MKSRAKSHVNENNYKKAITERIRHEKTTLCIDGRTNVQEQ